MTRNRLSLPVSVVKEYALDVIQGKMPPIQLRVSQEHTTPFPKDRSRLKSFYEYRQRSLSLDRRGRLRGGTVRLVSVLFDFTFTRSIFAAAYSAEGGSCYDPVSLCVLLLFAFLDGYEYISNFVTILHDADQGRQYRTLAGIEDEAIPQEADFSNFLTRCGHLFDQVLAVVVEMLHLAGLISGRVQTTDGMLVPTFSRYRGCNYFDAQRCARLTPPAGLAERVQQRLDELASQLSNSQPVCAGYVRMDCPFWAELLAAHPTLKKRKQPTQVRLLHVRLHRRRQGVSLPDKPDGRQLLAALGLEVHLDETVFLEVVDCRLARQEGKLSIACLRIPSDVQARLGVHIDPRTGQEEFVFGRDVLTTSNVEVRLGNLTLPIAVSIHPAGIREGNVFPEHHQQTDQQAFSEKLHILDGGYDDEEDYAYLRQRGCLPIITYNPRREDLSPPALQQRGYDEQGWPLADCGRPMPPLTPLADGQQTHHACQHQCQMAAPPQAEPLCPFLQQELGQTRTMRIADLPRLVAEVVRGTPEREKVEGLRSPSESVNSFTQTCCGLKAPRLRGDDAFFARAHLSILATLLRKAADFIQDMTRLVKRLDESQTDPLAPPNPSPRQRRLMDWLWALIYDDS
jgi:hypothetical protein